MELKQRFGSRTVFVVLYLLAFLAYIIYGLQPAETYGQEVTANLSVPSIDLNTDVAALALENHELKTPDNIAGSYESAQNKVFLIGHSSTVFRDLHKIDLDDTLNYNGKSYRVISIKTLSKNRIDMDQILAAEERGTLIIMTCAGRMLEGGDATHRLIVTAISA